MLRFIKTFLPYTHRILLWPEIWRQFWLRVWLCLQNSSKKEKLLSQEEQDKKESLKWCQSQAINNTQALTILDLKVTLTNVEKQFREEMRFAHEQVKKCPVQMGNAGNLDLLYTMCEGLQANKVLETGVAYGWSSLALLLSIQKRKGKLLSIDRPYFARRNDKWVGCVVPNSLKKFWKLMRMADREGIPITIRFARRFDLAHYDSDKSAKGRLHSYPQIWKSLRKDGLLVSDDIEDNLGFKTFCDNIKETPIIVNHDNKYQGILVKKQEYY